LLKAFAIEGDKRNFLSIVGNEKVLAFFDDKRLCDLNLIEFGFDFRRDLVFISAIKNLNFI